MWLIAFCSFSIMKLVKEQPSIDLLNFEVESGRKKHGKLLPDSLRCACVGPSSCGKTSTLLSLLLSPNGLKYAGVYVYSKSIEQPKYKYLESVFSGLKEIPLHMYSNAEQVIDVDHVKNDSICIFDDVSMEQQNVIRDFFSRSRHRGIDCFYLCQSYASIPKLLIRDNCNTLITFRQDRKNLTHIYQDFVGTDMTMDEFQKMCKFCWNKKFGFLFINKENDISQGRYKFLFDTIIVPDGLEDGEATSCA